MKFIGWFATTLGFLMVIQTHAQTEARFAEYVSAWKSPNMLWDNNHALTIRLQLLDVAPQGAHVDIATFLWDNGDSTRILAAHICRAARRGVAVRLLVDSKSGSIPGALNLFDQPVSEEVFQYMANCGARVRIFNHLPKFVEIAGHVAPAIEYLINTSFSHGPVDPQVAINRLNHRKIYYIETPDGRKCIILGGRNLGDSYLTWKPDSFVDGDIVLCDHHLAHLLSQPGGEKLAQAFAQAKMAYADTWEGKDETAGVPLQWYDVKANPGFKFQHLTLASQTDHKGSLMTRDSAEFALVHTTATPTPEATIPVARPIPTGNALQGEPLVGIKSATVLTSGWHAEHDYIRQQAHDMIRREQLELYIETAYAEFDQETESLLIDALDRGVKVTVVTNSMYTSDGASKLISLVRAAWTEQALGKYGQHNTPDFDSYYADSNRLAPLAQTAGAATPVAAAPGEFHFFVTTAAAGHMIHFKGWAGKCQKADDGTYHKLLKQGSHNLHDRSGLTDKEDGLYLAQEVDLDCIEKVGRDKFTAAEIAAAEARYQHVNLNGTLIPTRPKPEFRDWIDSRKRFWSGLNRAYAAAGKPVLKYFPHLVDELKQKDPHGTGLTADHILSLGYGFIASHIIEPVDPASIVKDAGPLGECKYLLQKAESHFMQGVFKGLTKVASPFL